MKRDQVQTLNYCAHAIEDLRETASLLMRCAPQSAAVTHRLIAMLQDSVKFILPNCCNLVGPGELRKTHMDLLRLPFPCVAFEASWEQEDDGKYIGEFEITPATKRIALCWDTAAFEPMPGLSSAFDVFPNGGVFVLPIYWGPAYKRWTVALGGTFIPYENELTNLDMSTAPLASQMATSAKIEAGHVNAKSLQFRAEPFPIQPEFFEHAVATYGSRDKANAQIIVDSSDEAMMLIQACSVINCANVTTGQIDPPPALNRKRRAGGKQPFFTYKVLELTGERSATGDSAVTHHASPRMHLRRGHLRQLQNKSVWVRPSLINAGSQSGVVVKEYRVRPDNSLAQNR